MIFPVKAPLVQAQRRLSLLFYHTFVHALCTSGIAKQFRIKPLAVLFYHLFCARPLRI